MHYLINIWRESRNEPCWCEIFTSMFLLKEFEASARGTPCLWRCCIRRLAPGSGLAFSHLKRNNYLKSTLKPKKSHTCRGPKKKNWFKVFTIKILYISNEMIEELLNCYCVNNVCDDLASCQAYESFKHISFHLLISNKPPQINQIGLSKTNNVCLSTYSRI